MFIREKDWLYVALTCFFELCWIFGFSTASQWWHWIVIVGLILLDFTFLTKACKKIPTGTVYAIFAGIGAIGATVFDKFLFNKTIHLTQLIFVALIIIGVMLLKCADSKS